MTGSLRLKNGIWQMEFRWKDSNGKWCKVERSTGLKERGNKRAAQAMLNERIPAMKEQYEVLKVQEQGLFLSEMEKWLGSVMVYEVRANTLNQYKAVFKKHIKGFAPFQGLKVTEVTPKLLQDFVNEEFQSGLAPESVRKHYANLHKFFDYLWRLDVIPSNPTDKVILPKRNREQRGKVFSKEQCLKLLELFEGDPLELVVLLAMTYGLRRSEVCGLKWSAIDFDNRFLHVCHTAVVDCGKVVYSDNTKSRSSRRKLPLTDMVYNALKRTWQEQARNQMRMGDSYQRSGYVCCWPDGRPLLPEFITKHYRSVLEKSDLPFIQFRNLRDTAATLLHREGADVKSVSSWLGHAEVGTTANIYVHCQEADMSDMAESMNRALKRA